ncbi:MAG: C-GCAxxG-C-C family protein [Intestinimonas sp.]|jgi:C_GCAxxG_C_C family probable redox protein|nr:C-GCAxxG-C-C family protein [Intestinimonas sp.]
MDHVKHAKELHQSIHPHYNCCQAVLVPFAEERGLDTEAAFRLAAQFGSGMRRGSVCGAVTGGLMALGLLGADGRTAAEFQRRFCEKNRALDCAVLLKNAKDNGEDRAEHCDRMVCQAVELVDELLANQKDK